MICSIGIFQKGVYIPDIFPYSDFVWNFAEYIGIKQEEKNVVSRNVLFFFRWFGDFFIWD